MKKMRRIRCTAGWLLLALGMQAQQDPACSLYLFNKLVLNPAYAGSTGELSLRMSSRWQWVGVRNAPRTQAFSLHLPTPGGRHGFGLNQWSDRLGHTSSQRFHLAYAYRIPMAGGHLALGMDLGMSNLRLNGQDIAFFEEADPFFGAFTASINHFVAGAGAYFQNDRFYAGISSPDFLPHRLDGLYPGQGTGRVPTSVYGMVGGALPLGESVKLRPSAMLRVTTRLPLGGELGLAAMFRDRILAGMAWRPGNSLVFLMQAYFLPRVQVGYAYDLRMNPFRVYGLGGHEVMLGVDLNVHHATREPLLRF
jgi:type IX secretion system PorP/SprF family membrane protein